MKSHAWAFAAKALVVFALFSVAGPLCSAQSNPPPPKKLPPLKKVPPKKGGDQGNGGGPPPKQPPPKGPQPGGGPPPKGPAPTGGVGKQPGTVTRPDGGATVTDQRGNRVEYSKSGQRQSLTTANGTQAHFGRGGKITSVSAPNGTRVYGTPGRARTLVTEHVSSSGVPYRVVNGGPRNVYVERPFRFGGQDYRRRTYVYGGRTIVSVYRGVPYRGVTYYRYVPARYYAPGYYRWAYTRWAVGAPYPWGWNRNPWFVSYGYYWTPYPTYAAPDLWLTDYILAANLQAAYDAQAQANASNRGAPPPPQTDSGAPDDNAVAMAPSAKELVDQAVEVRLGELQKESDQGANPQQDTGGAPVQSTDEVPEALTPAQRGFVVGTTIEIQNGDQPCLLNPGDVLERTATEPDAQQTVAVNVVSSQKTTCAVGTASRVSVADLQEMNNHLDELLDGGMNTLATTRWQTGNAAPPAAARDNMDFKKLPTAPDTATLAVDLRQQQADADVAQKDALQEAATIKGVPGSQ